MVERGYVTYDNRAKEEDLGIEMALLEEVGAVSQEVAEAMAKGALARAGVNLALATTASPARAARPRPSRWAWSTSRSPATPTAPATSATC